MVRDETAAFLREGYAFIGNRCSGQSPDGFTTRLGLRRTVCLRGAEAAAEFYDESRYQRAGAAPPRLLRTLFGRGGVQGLDGDAHRARKQLFLEVTRPQRVASLAELFRGEWERRAAHWPGRRVVLYDQIGLILCRAVCEWAGVPLPPDRTAQLTRDLHAMIEGGAHIGPGYWRARLARLRWERWLGSLIRRVRAGEIPVAPGTALDAVASYREPDGTVLGERVAAVELLNVVRPVVAVDRWVVFVAHALHEHPQWRELLRGGDPVRTGAFVQEVRRHYPFFPAVIARARTTHTWHGLRIRRGDRVLLDLYGTNHDPRTWTAPELFQPSRFETATPDEFAFVPQGGGRADHGHRCPGESIAVAVMSTAAGLLAAGLSYDVPPQDLSIDLSRMPALPASGFVLDGVRSRTVAARA